MESVRIEASGIATFVAAGGFSFSAPVSRIEAAGLADLVRGRGSAGPFEVSDEAMAALRDLSSAWAARKKAIELCARAEQSEAGLGAKLRSRGFPAQAVRAALEELKAEGILDDDRFAEVWAHQRMARKGADPASIAMGLRSRGLSEASVRKALLEFPVMESLRDAFAAWAAGLESGTAGRAGPPDRTPSLLRAQLRSRGYRGDDIDAAWDEWLDSLAKTNEY